MLLYSYSDHLVLHSFPTRRSSDLIGGMTGSYIGIITAVLVVNGMDIPLINQMPSLLLWFIPTIIGTPFIFMVNKRYSPDRKSTRLNSSHVAISYAVFCLKKKNHTS